MNEQVIIVGRRRPDRENLTSVLCDGCRTAGIPFRRVDGTPFETSISPNAVVVHASSPGRFPSVLEACEQEDRVLIAVSSGIDVPTTVKIPLIKTPNLALPFLALFDITPRLGKLMQILGARTVIAEGHQASKTSVPITAKNLARDFGIDPSGIGTVRSDALAEAVLDIPAENTGGFACHYLKTVAGEVEIKIQTRILGRHAYFLGLQMLLARINEIGLNLRPGIHEAHKLMFPADVFVQENINTNRALKEELKKLREELSTRVPVPTST